MRNLLLLLALAGVAFAAPAPPPRPPKVKPLPPAPAFVGSWLMEWKAGHYRVTLGPDGSYQCGDSWAGTWCLDEKTFILYVEELSSAGSVLHWSVTMQGPLRGILDDGTEWKLEPPPGVDR
jgi:hypothetical protein